MWPISAAARAVLRGPHAVSTRVTAHTLLQGELQGLPLSGGTVTADAKSQVRRTATISVGDPALWPIDPYAPLSPLGTELALEYGIVVPGRDEPEWVPLLRGPIQSTTGKLPATSALSVTVHDRAQAVADDRLTVPGQTTPGATCVQEITRLITESLPAAEVVDRTGGLDRACPVIDIDRDRWADGVEVLADAMGAEVYTDQTGLFVIRAVPTLDDPPVWVIDAGETGVLITADRDLTREQVYNAVAVSGERTDGTAPVHALVVDDDPASPTRWGGPFGRRPRFYSSPLITSIEQAEQTGRALLARVKGYAATVKAEAVPNPALEPGDVVLITLPNSAPQRHIVDVAPCPLTVGPTQMLTTRSIDVLPAEQ